MSDAVAERPTAASLLARHTSGHDVPEPAKLHKLMVDHRNQLVTGSAIDPAVIAERGYESLHRGSTTTDVPRHQARLKAAGIPTFGYKEPERLPGLLIPTFRPAGQREGALWKSDSPAKDKSGRSVKYLGPKGKPAVIDCHPRNARHMTDPTVELWITEGVKKADCLTSRGVCAVSISGVYNWKANGGTNPYWEEIQLRGRTVVICFDADAVTKRDVLSAMRRLGVWLRSKGAKPLYLVTPGEVSGRATKGVDDYFAAGGTQDGLRAAILTTVPRIEITDGAFTDRVLAETVVDDVMEGHFIWGAGLGWLRWDGVRWVTSDPQSVHEAVGAYALQRFSVVTQAMATAAARSDLGEVEKLTTAQKGWKSLLGASRIRAVSGLCEGLTRREAKAFDADPDLLNTPSGIVELRTGKLWPHDPDALMTKVTRGSYRPGYTHPDWEEALTALRADVGDWMQVRYGQGITGRPTPDGVMVLMQGGGENGKGVLGTDGVVPAAGDYAAPASRKLLQATRGTEHSTEMADLRGQRLLIAEELTEGKSIDVSALKSIQDVGTIKARYIRQDNITFEVSHSLFATTNYIPVVAETDHGTWRRLALVKFPYRFRKPGEPMETDLDRPGDPRLKERIKAGRDGQHDAIVTWLVEGARRYYAEPDAMTPPPSVQADTLEWRREADRILGFWGECLVPERGAMVATAEVLTVFNEWLAAGGHAGWAKETFGPRFRSHSETQRHRVEVRRTRNADAVAQPPHSLNAALPSQPEVYLGVRYRTASDLQ